MALEISYPSVNVRALLVLGHAALDAAHATKHAELAGVLRAGSSGCVINDDVYGECHRIAHLRQRGVDKKVSDSRKLMFQAGEANEDLWQNVLSPSWPGKVLRKQRAQKQGSWGTVSGEPDIVLADADGAWQLGLELKLVSATNTAITRELEGEPDSKHLIQSAVYMWLTGLPYVLCYTSRTDFAIEFKRKQYGGLTKLEPFYRLFYLSFKDDRLYYRDEYNSNDVPTGVTGAGIVAYYQRVADIAHTYDLGHRPQNHHVNGHASTWNKCDPRYCAFSNVCDRYEGDYATWLDAATRITMEAL